MAAHRSTMPSLDAASRALIELGIQHEQQHQELILTDVKHLLSRNPLRPAYQKHWPLTPVERAQRGLDPRAGGRREIGHDGDGFRASTTRRRATRVWLDDFEIASHPVTHGDFLAFIDDGGYRRPELWLSLGWDAVCARGWQAPLYWERDRRRMAYLHAARHGARRAEHARSAT